MRCRGIRPARADFPPPGGLPLPLPVPRIEPRAHPPCTRRRTPMRTRAQGISRFQLFAAGKCCYFRRLFCGCGRCGKGSAIHREGTTPGFHDVEQRGQPRRPLHAAHEKRIPGRTVLVRGEHSGVSAIRTWAMCTGNATRQTLLALTLAYDLDNSRLPSVSYTPERGTYALAYSCINLQKKQKACTKHRTMRYMAQALRRRH